MKLKVLFFVVLTTQLSLSQDADKNLPYYEIPEYPDSYNAGTTVARMIDGLGFRYYWATEGLRDEDLAFKPSEEGRTTEETVDHLYGLTKVILNAALKQPNIAADEEAMSFADKRSKTLKMLKQAADIFREATDLTEYNLVFSGDNGTNEFPFWNMINGPIADALWHCGQVVTHRRTSGNPFNSKASVFTGKVRN